MRALAVALLCLSAAPAAAAGWRAGEGGRAAGYADGAGYAGLWLRCGEGGGLRLFASTGGRDPGAGVEHTLVVDVDGTAFLQRGRVDPSTGALAAPLSAAAAPALLDALRKGKAVEVSSPAGRFTLPLKGSGKALEVLARACGLAPPAR